LHFVPKKIKIDLGDTAANLCIRWRKWSHLRGPTSSIPQTINREKRRRPHRAMQGGHAWVDDAGVQVKVQVWWGVALAMSRNHYLCYYLHTVRDFQLRKLLKK
jgi:hypothetical protein